MRIQSLVPALGLATLMTATASAQKLSVQYVPNPVTKSFIAKLTVTGSPAGRALIFACPRSQSGVKLPGLGELYLDPSMPIVQIAALRLDSSGKATLTVPLPRIGFELVTQAVVVDAKGGALTNMSSLGQSFAGLSACGVHYDAYDRIYMANATVTVNVIAPPGTKVTLVQNDMKNKQTLVLGTATVGTSGILSLKTAATLHRGDGLAVVVKSGQSTTTYKFTVK